MKQNNTLIKPIRILGSTAGLLFLLSGCGSGPRLCDARAYSSGHVCYRGLDFGVSSDPDYRAGVRDGCETGDGTFRKDYRLSRSSAAYRQGWDRGRTLCRPAGWSDTPTYSYHPLPQNSDWERRAGMEPYVSTEERIRRYTNEE